MSNMKVLAILGGPLASGMGGLMNTSYNSFRDGNGKKRKRLKVGIQGPQKALDWVQGQCPSRGQGAKPPEAGDKSKFTE